MQFDEIKAMEQQYVMQTYGRSDIALVRGEGATLIDSEGRRYIDMGSGIGVNSLGYGHPQLTQAICEQAQQLMHCSNLYYSEPMVQVARHLVEASGLSRVFFANSGAEANEGAIKFARKYSFDKYGAGRSTIITLVNSFHGRTITTLAATGQDSFHKVFDPFTPGFKYCPANDIAALQAAATDDVCAVLFECVQGEGGVNNLSPTFVSAIAKLAKEKDILIAVDEVQTGNGRTGTYFAYQQYGITPDIVTTAKGLGGGLPIGAVLFGEKLQDTMTPGSHGSTFGGNPVVAAGACSIVERIDDDFLREVQRKSEKIRTALAKVKGVKSISGMGLMLGIETDKPAGEVAKACLANGLLILTAKTKLRLLPALNISDAELDEGLEILKGVLEA